jgi:hypothetical protein
MLESRVDELARKLGVEWPAIQRARATTETNRLKLRHAFHGRASSDPAAAEAQAALRHAEPDVTKLLAYMEAELARTPLERVFEPFPKAGLCFDINHARQVDPTMVEARLILERFSNRLAEVHISEVNTASRHEPLSHYAIVAFQVLATLIPADIPVTLETLIDKGQSDIPTEIERARAALPSSSGVLTTT